MTRAWEALFRLSFASFLVVRGCTGSEFQCINGSSVPLDNVCDFTYQCMDGSDERECSSYERCDFQSNYCNWTCEQESQNGWIRKKSRSRPGRMDDHLGKHSAYLLLLPQDGPRAFASLRSIVFLPPNDICQMRFYYHFGQVNGSLNVGLRQKYNGPYTKIWEHKSIQGLQWKREVITINSNQQYEVIIQGTIFNTSQSNEALAVDDISFSKGCLPAFVEDLPCEEGFNRCNKECVPESKFCNFVYDCLPLFTDEESCPPTCDFESGLCGWYPGKANLMWQQRRASESSGNTAAPLKDHSTNTPAGHYIWLRAQDVDSSSPSLKSSVYHNSGPNCRLEFYYQISGKHILTVSLKIQEEERILWEERESTENRWIQAEVHLSTCLKQFQVIFTGSIQSTIGFLALDSLRFNDCELAPYPESCQPSTFACSIGLCVPNASVCDFQTDCCDGADEESTTCANYTMCSFETNFCDWKQLSTDGSTWVRGSAETSPSSGLPKTDHTTETNKGTFVYFQASSESATDGTAQLGSPVLRKQFIKGSLCQVRFWYQMSLGAKLSVYMRTVVDGHSKRLTESTTATNRVWAFQEITVETNAAETIIPFQIILQASFTAMADSFVVIDDITLTPGCAVYNALLPNSITDHKATNCTFEASDCGWVENIPSDDFDWIRSSRNALPPAIKNQTPAHDHTTNKPSGHFMFILNNRSSISQIAALKSPRFSQSGTGCTMSFWYYNYGQAVGAAKMYLDMDGVQNRTVVWWTYNTQSDRWQQALVQLGRLHRPFHLLLVKVSLSFYDGVTAVDDIKFINCSLPQAVESCDGPDHFWCKETRACIDRLHVCDLLDHCGDASDEENCPSDLLCDFENGLCNWEQATEDDFDWTRNRGQTPSLNTGPSKDHTFGTSQGYYFYIEVSEQQFEDTAMLVSPILKATNNNAHKNCIFRFHYHMFGMQIFRLAVYKRIYRNTKGIQLWVKYGNQGDAWQREVLFINSSQPFQILLEATVGDDIGGDIGIDDLSFMDCALHDANLPSAAPTNPSATTRPTTLPPHNCTENQFICKIDGRCIEIIKTCDFREDCSDKTDELACVDKLCNFDSGKNCGWKQQISSSAENIFQWFTGQGSSIHPGEEDDRPSTDHTTGTPKGWYLYADSSNGEFGDSSNIVIPTISQTGPMCKLVFWYHMNGVTIGTLQVFIKFGKVTWELWSQSGSQGNRWTQGMVFLGVQTSYQIMFRATRGVSYMGDIAVDDISFQDCAPLLISNTACNSDEYACANKYCIPKDQLCDFVNDCADHSDEHPVICGTVLGHCDFEFDMCSWRQLRDDSFDWTLKPGRTPTMGTGPATDHTLRRPSGHYIYIESSFPQLPGHVARISGPPISKRSKDCKILFYYHMAGHSIGSLIIYQVTVSDRRVMLLNLTGDQGNYWQQAKIPLSADEDFEIMFEGWVGKGTKGDISLDDITFTKECISSSMAFLEEPTELPPTDSCPQGYLECQNGQCYQPRQRCDFVNDCGDNTDEIKCGASCTFEAGQCGWKNSLADNFDWVLGKGSFQSARPSKDHTLGNQNGHFMYLEAMPVGLKGDKAHMKSSKWKESSNKCILSFWYYTTWKMSGLINVLIKTDSNLYRVWSKVGSRSDVWNKANVPLKKLRNFEIIFEGIRTQDFGGGAAIDDIQFTNCATEEYLPGLCPAATDFICKNGQCIKSDLVCDYKPDCEDESDESDCSQFVNVPGSCQFDGPDTESCISDCGLMQNTDDDFNWTLGNGTITRETGPTTDHTPGAGGMFAYVNSLAQREGDIARLTTDHHFPASLRICHLRFWVYMYGSREMGTLKVYTVGENGMDLLIYSVTGNQKPWKYVNMILYNNYPFQVAFEAEVGGDNLTVIAIDDISFSLECVSGVSNIPPATNCTADTFQCLIGPECVPQLWRCDAKEDCADGSDELNCPTEAPGNLPSQHPCGKKEFLCSNEDCIPSLLRCDGVPDCPSAEDELNCPELNCFNDSLLCESTGKCIPVTQRCDNVTNCKDYQQDESGCAECPNGFCKNGGTCIIANEIALCTCTSQWRGNRCHLNIKPNESPNPNPTETKIVAQWSGIGLSLAFALLIVVTVLVTLSRKKTIKKPLSSLKCNSISNILYGDPSADLTAEFATKNVLTDAAISVYPWHNQHMVHSSKGNVPHSFCNLLYDGTTYKTKVSTA